MDLEKRAQEVETAGYLANDTMIIENLGDHADAEVAKGAKQVTENCIKTFKGDEISYCRRNLTCTTV